MNKKIYYKNYNENPTKLSVITATYNVGKFLPRLIKSLQEQVDKDFEWIVSDGASSDKTLEILKNTGGINIKVISGEDFGIYDALNRGIKACNGEFYLVIGADDELYPNAIQDYKKAIEGGADIITARIDTNNGKIEPNSGPKWLISLYFRTCCRLNIPHKSSSKTWLLFKKISNSSRSAICTNCCKLWSKDKSYKKCCR